MKRSPKRSSECWMRSTWTMSTPMPSTLMAKVSVHLAHSPVIILHSREHFAHGVFPTYKNCARNNGVPDVELGQMRNPVNERDVSVIDAMAGVDLKFCIVRTPRTLTQAIQLLRFDSFCERVRQFAGVQFDHFHSQSRRAVDLFFVGINKQTDADAIGVESLDGIEQIPTIGDGIEPAFC